MSAVDEQVRMDLDRLTRLGAPEVVFAPNKSPAQLAHAVDRLLDAGQNVLVTRVSPEQAETLCARFEGLVHDATARTLTQIVAPPASLGSVAVLTAGSSDVPVAEEAAACLAFFGGSAERFYDVGVAGLHRVLGVIEHVRTFDVVIVVAGMDGALPAVVGGLVKRPVIFVPTSVGYGASFDGLAALLSGLNACAAGVTVVNIDNGFGAARAAHRILAP